MILKTYKDYGPIKENTGADSYILKNEDRSHRWVNIKIDPFKNEIKTGNVKTEENIKTKQDINREEDIQNTIKRVSFVEQENKVKQDRHE